MALKFALVTDAETLKTIKAMTSDAYRATLIQRVITLHKRRMVAQLNLRYGHIKRTRAFVDVQASEKSRKGRLISTGVYKLV